jgi:predicted glycosyltransferase involved in capsule biosynthesis
MREEEGFKQFELILVEGDSDPNTSAKAMCAEYGWVHYYHLPMQGVFHKSKLLNYAASVAQGTHLIMYDVDLLPSKGVLSNHLQLAQESRRCLVAGYRVQLPNSVCNDLPLPNATKLLEDLESGDLDLICPEDDIGALRNYLVGGERFGVCSCIPHDLFRAIGGVNEQFIGWGCEDQDLIHRLCSSGLTLVRSYDLLYFHLPHDYESEWRSQQLTEANRRNFYRIHTPRSRRE